MSRRLVPIVFGLLVSACGGSSTPTTPTAVTPAVTTTIPTTTTTVPPTTTTIPPTITNYAGRWVGEYVVSQCAGASGSMDDVLCSAPRPGSTGGIFQLGARFPITIELTQSGSTVTGAMSLGAIRGTVNGSVLNQRLILSGTLIYSDAASGLTLTNTITSWDTSITSDVLTGFFALNIRFNVFPGDGVVRLLLQNTMRR